MVCLSFVSSILSSGSSFFIPWLCFIWKSFEGGETQALTTLMKKLKSEMHYYLAKAHPKYNEHKGSFVLLGIELKGITTKCIHIRRAN